MVLYSSAAVERLAAARPTELSARTICLVHNPFTRLVSFYLDKVRRFPTHGVIPPGVEPYNATFDQFIHAAMRHDAAMMHGSHRNEA